MAPLLLLQLVLLLLVFVGVAAGGSLATALALATAAAFAAAAALAACAGGDVASCFGQAARPVFTGVSVPALATFPMILALFAVGCSPSELQPALATLRQVVR